MKQAGNVGPEAVEPEAVEPGAGVPEAPAGPAETHFLPVKYKRPDHVIVVDELYVDAALRLAEQRARDNRRLNDLLDELATREDVEDLKRELEAFRREFLSGLRSWQRHFLCCLVAAQIVQTAMVVGALYFTGLLR